MTYQDQKPLFALMAAIEDRISIASSKTNEGVNEWSDARMGGITKGLCQINACRELRDMPRERSQALSLEEKTMPKQDTPMQQYQDCEDLRQYDDRQSDSLLTWQQYQNENSFRMPRLPPRIAMDYDDIIKAISWYVIGVIIGFVIFGFILR